MKRSAAWAVASLLAVAVGASGSCLAAEAGVPTGSSAAAVLGALSGTAVPTAELGRERARGITINTGAGAATDAGTSAGNTSIGSLTGSITTDHSIDNNAGITSVLQNFGNNSVMQVSTTININVH